MNQKIRVFGRCIFRRIPIARWVETGVEGSTLAIRLRRPFVIVQDFPKKIKYIMTLLKISCLSMTIYDILINMHWQSSLGSAAVRESCTLAEPPIKDFTDAEDILSKMKINYNVILVIN